MLYEVITRRIDIPCVKFIILRFVITSYSIHYTKLYEEEYAQQIKEIVELGVQVGIVIGGGNIFRGLSGAAKGFDRYQGDQMGMLATVINSLALKSSLNNNGVV